MSTIELVDPELRDALTLWPVLPLTAESTPCGGVEQANGAANLAPAAIKGGTLLATIALQPL